MTYNRVVTGTVAEQARKAFKIVRKYFDNIFSILRFMGANLSPEKDLVSGLRMFSLTSKNREKNIICIVSGIAKYVLQIQKQIRRQKTDSI